MHRGASCCYLLRLTEYGKGACLLAHSLHARFVITPDVAVVEPLRSEIARVQLLAGAYVIPELFDQVLQSAAVAEASPPATPYRFMREDALPAVVIDEPDLAAVIDFHDGIAIHGLAVEKTATLVVDDPDCLIDLLAPLPFDPQAVFLMATASILRLRLVIGGPDHTVQ